MKYKGSFNYCGQTITLWTSAKSEKQAFKNFIYQLVKKIGVIKINLYNYFKSSEIDNYLVEEVK